MALAMALEEEERRLYQAQRRAAASSSTRGVEEGTIGPKIRFASAADVAAGRGAFGVDPTRAADDPGGDRRRWGAADAEAMAASGLGRSSGSDAWHSSESPESPPADGRGRDGGERRTRESGGGDGGRDSPATAEGGDEDGDGEAEAFAAIPGGGRRKGKMPLFMNSEGETVSKHDAVISGR